MIISKFNLKTKKILITLLTIAILAMTISNVSAAIDKVEISAPNQITVNSSSTTNTFTHQVIVKVYDSGNLAKNVDVDIYRDNTLQQKENTGDKGYVSFMPMIITSSATVTYKAIAGGKTASHTITYVDVGTGNSQNDIIIRDDNPGGNNPGGNNLGGNNPGGNNPNTGNSDKLSLKKGVIYKGIHAVGIWDGNDAYTLNSKGLLVKSTSYTKQVQQGIAKGLFGSSKISSTTTSKIIAFVNNIATNKISNSAINAVSKIYTKATKGAIASKLIAAEIAANNLGAKKFRGNNVILSSNAIKTVLNKGVSKKYIARKNVKVKTLKTALIKGKSILRVKNVKSKNWKYIAISKVSKKRVTVFDNKISKKVAIGSLTSYMKKKFKFSGVAITFNVKIGKKPTTAYLKAATGF